MATGGSCRRRQHLGHTRGSERLQWRGATESIRTSVPPSTPWQRCDAPLHSRAAGDGRAGGTVWGPQPQPHSRCRNLSQILAAPAQSNASDGSGQLIIDGRLETLSAARPRSRGTRGAGREGEAGEEEGAQPAHPHAAFCICHPRDGFFHAASCLMLKAHSGHPRPLLCPGFAAP